MSLGVTGAFSNINAVQRLNAEELRLGISGEASWHHQYKDSCYIYISGLDPRLTEGDVAIVFSQWGEPIDIVLVRDQKTGVPRGFGFLGYEDQRSTVLAVDNANGMKLLQRTLRVDHCKDFRPPTSADGDKGEAYQPTGAEGGGINKHLITKSEKQLHKSREQQKRLQQQRHQQAIARAAAGSKDVDEMWAEEFELMLSNLNDEADAEMDALVKEDKRLKKKLKKEKKMLKKAMKNRGSSNSRSRSRSRSNRRSLGNKEQDRSETHRRSSRRDESESLSKTEESSSKRDYRTSSRDDCTTKTDQHASCRSSKRDAESNRREESSSRKNYHTSRRDEDTTRRDQHGSSSSSSSSSTRRNDGSSRGDYYGRGEEDDRSRRDGGSRRDNLISSKRRDENGADREKAGITRQARERSRERERDKRDRRRSNSRSRRERASRHSPA